MEPQADRIARAISAPGSTRVRVRAGTNGSASGLPSSPIQGRWIDMGGTFFSGAVIEITEEGWRPLDMKMEAHRTATYCHKLHSRRRAELTEQRSDGSVRTFRVTAGPSSKTLHVELPAHKLQWTLVRDETPGTGMGTGFHLRFDDVEDELLHSREVDQRNQPALLGLCGVLLASVVGEVARDGRATLEELWSSGCLALAVVAGVAAVQLGLVFADIGAVIVGCMGSAVLLQVSFDLDEEHREPCKLALSQDGVTLLCWALLTFLTHTFMEVRTAWSWMLPAVQVVYFVFFDLFYYGTREGNSSLFDGALCAVLLAALGLACWRKRWLDERAERRSWVQRRCMERRNAELEEAQSRINEVMEQQDHLMELALARNPRRLVKMVKRNTEDFAERRPSRRSSEEDGVWHRKSEPPRAFAARSTSRSPSPARIVRTCRRGLTMCKQLGRSSSESFSGSASSTWTLPEMEPPQRTLQAPLLPEPALPAALLDTPPNGLLVAAMAGQQGQPSRVRSIAEKIRLPGYSLRSFFEDCAAAFPELGLFFVRGQGTTTSSGRSAEVEYQRTIGALFAVYWLLRIDVKDGKGREGFCFGVDAEWNTISNSMPGVEIAGKPTMELTEDEKRHIFFSAMDWTKFSEVIRDALFSHSGNEVDRIVAMLTLTAFHDIMKVGELCPVVQEQHAPYHNYEAGSVIMDHDVALAYVLEHYSHLLPSFQALPPKSRETVVFTQAKMQFNHGWFVQAEAPPGPMLSGFKRIAKTAAEGDIAFYFFHWLTDLAGAEGTPLAGADKFVVKFPPKVLHAFLWSMPYLQRLRDNSETAVVEEYLKARWRDTLPQQAVPKGPRAVAQMRLATMSGSTAVGAFHSLGVATKDLLSREMAMTGMEDQRYLRAPSKAFLGPAFLVYYGPALLARCEGDYKHMRAALIALAAVYRAGRSLWPSRPDMKQLTVTLEIGQLKSLSIDHVYTGEVGEPRRIWALVRQNNQEAACRLVGGPEISGLIDRGEKFAFLELEEGEDISEACCSLEEGDGDEDEDWTVAEPLGSTPSYVAVSAMASYHEEYDWSSPPSLRTPLLTDLERGPLSSPSSSPAISAA